MGSVQQHTVPLCQHCESATARRLSLHIRWLVHLCPVAVDLLPCRQGLSLGLAVQPKAQVEALARRARVVGEDTVEADVARVAAERVGFAVLQWEERLIAPRRVRLEGAPSDCAMATGVSTVSAATAGRLAAAARRTLGPVGTRSAWQRGPEAWRAAWQRGPAAWRVEREQCAARRRGDLGR